MNSIRKIVAGTDFNDLATAALRFSAGVAAQAGAELVVVYADQFEPPAEFTSGQVKRIAESILRSKARAHEELTRYVAQHVPPEVNRRIIVAEGAPAVAIPSIAEAEEADFIALGTHGRGGWQRLVVGSVAEAVIHSATVPVLTLTCAKCAPTIRRILCPVCDTPVAKAAVERAATLAAALSAELTLVRFGERSTHFDPAAIVSRLGVPVALLTRDSIGADAADAFLDLAHSDAYDLVVIGAEHRRMSDVTSFGTSAAAVVRHSPIPVLTVVSQPEAGEKSGREGALAHVV